MDKLECTHDKKTKKLLFACQVSGNYELLLCDDCYKNEGTQFLLEEHDITDSKSSGAKNPRGM